MRPRSGQFCGDPRRWRSYQSIQNCQLGPRCSICRLSADQRRWRGELLPCQSGTSKTEPGLGLLASSRASKAVARSAASPTGAPAMRVAAMRAAPVASETSFARPAAVKRMAAEAAPAAARAPAVARPLVIVTASVAASAADRRGSSPTASSLASSGGVPKTLTEDVSSARRRGSRLAEGVSTRACTSNRSLSAGSDLRAARDATAMATSRGRLWSHSAVAALSSKSGTSLKASSPTPAPGPRSSPPPPRCPPTAGGGWGRRRSRGLRRPYGARSGTRHRRGRWRG